jgi:hypothetical protein
MTGTSTVRRRAELLSLDWSHFTGQRRWSDLDLRNAIASSTSWNQVAITLGCPASAAKRHALRLDIPFAHIDRRSAGARVANGLDLNPDQSRMRHAGEALAAAWFQFCGYGVGIVTGQHRYDLLVSGPEGGAKRVQVKTTSYDAPPYGRPVFHLATRNYVSTEARAVAPYDVDDVDLFFLLRSIDLMWLVPHERLLGQVQCSPGPEFETYRIDWPR